MSVVVKRYIFTVFARLPLRPQLPTYRCVALSDVQGQEQTSSLRFKMRERPPIETDSSHCVDTPNSKPHLMVARRTIVDADMCVGSFRQ